VSQLARTTLPIFLTTVATSILGCLAIAQEPAAPVPQNADVADFVAWQAPPQVDSVVLNVWSLTVAESDEDEDMDALAGAAANALQQKAEVSTGDMGTADSVRSLIADLRLAGRLLKSSEVRLVTLGGEKATSQTGFDEPRVTATQLIARGAQANTVHYRKVGTVIEAQPMIEADRSIRINFSYESTSFEKDGGVPIAEPENGSALMADRIGQTQIRTAVRLKSGEATLLWSDAMHEAPAKSEEQSGESDDESDTKRDQSTGERRMIILSATIAD
jgi:hypothetical protein